MMPAWAQFPTMSHPQGREQIITCQVRSEGRERMGGPRLAPCITLSGELLNASHPIPLSRVPPASSSTILVNDTLHHRRSY